MIQQDPNNFWEQLERLEKLNLPISGEARKRANALRKKLDK